MKNTPKQKKFNLKKNRLKKRLKNLKNGSLNNYFVQDCLMKLQKTK